MPLATCHLPLRGVVLAGLAAGLVSFAGGEMAPFVVPAEMVNVNTLGSSGPRASRETPGVIARTAAVAYAMLGLCLGGGLGIAGGLSRRPASPAGAASGGSIGALLGAALGAGVAMGLVPSYVAAQAEHSDLNIVFGIALHLAAWAPIGMAAGLGFALGLGDRRLIGRAVAAGLAGAVAGTIVFDLIGALAMPLARSDAPIAEDWPPRLLARLLVGVGTAAVIAMIRPPADRIPVGAPDHL